jgi:hypothetical protein
MDPFFILWFSYFFVLVPAAEIPKSKKFESNSSIMCIVPEEAKVPDYSYSPGECVVKRNGSGSPVSLPISSKSYLECLPTDILTLTFSFLNFKDVGKIRKTSKYLHDVVEMSFEHLNAGFGNFDLSALSKKDQIIVVLHLLPLLKSAYPGLFRRKMTSADLICLSLLAFIASSNLKVVNKEVVMPTSQEFKDLFDAFSSMNFIMKLNDNVYNPIPIMLKCCGMFAALLTLVIKSEKIPYTLEAVNVLNRFPSVNNSKFNSRSISLDSLGLDMGVRDQRFINNLLINMPIDILVSTKLGQRHILHDFIVRKLEFIQEIFSKPELFQVQRDRETRSTFYEAALIYSIKYRNWSCLKGLLSFPDVNNFHSFSLIKLDFLRQITNYDENLSNYNTIALISDYLIN